MRAAIWRGLPSLTNQIHRPRTVNEEKEDDDDETVSTEVQSQDLDPAWTWHDAEKRLQAAYDTGGFPSWAKMAITEMEAERKVERLRRQREYEDTAVS